MKHLLVLTFLFIAATAPAADLTLEDLPEDLQDQLEDSVRIINVNSDTTEDDDDNRIEVISFQTYQDENDQFQFRVRVTAELTDKEDTIVYGQFMRPQGNVPHGYTGEDDWKFEMQHTGLKRAKLSAYVIEYGILYNNDFIVLATEMDDVDSKEEILDRAGNRVPLTSSYHHVWYRE